MIGKRITVKTSDNYEITFEVVDKIIVAKRITRQLHQHEQYHDYEKLSFLAAVSVTNYLCKTISIRNNKEDLKVYSNPKSMLYFEVGRMALVDPCEFWDIAEIEPSKTSPT